MDKPVHWGCTTRTEARVVNATLLDPQAIASMGTSRSITARDKACVRIASRQRQHTSCAPALTFFSTSEHRMVILSAFTGKQPH